MIEAAKTDWTYDDVINYTDFQRIYHSQLYVSGRIPERLGLTSRNLHESGLNSYWALGYVSEINKIENNLRILIEDAGQTAIGYVIESWPLEDRNPDYTDANRWELTTQQIKVTVYYTYLYLMRCGVAAHCGQPREWQVRFRNLAGLMWDEFEEYDMTWDYFDELDMTWLERDYQPL